MALEALKAEIGLILEMFLNPPHDRYELYVQLKEKLNEMRVFGMTPPEDLPLSGTSCTGRQSTLGLPAKVRAPNAIQRGLP